MKWNVVYDIIDRAYHGAASELDFDMLHAEIKQMQKGEATTSQTMQKLHAENKKLRAMIQSLGTK